MIGNGAGTSAARQTAPLPPALLGPWRRRFQWLTSALILLVPFIRIGGTSLLRLDLPSLSLHLLGRTLPIEDLDLFLLLALALLLLFLLATLVLGRAWCGWACPQTTLSDLAEWLAARLGLLPAGKGLDGPPGRRLVLHLGLVLLALLAGANLVWYFVSPYQFFPRLLQGTLHPAAIITLATVAVVVYGDLALVRRLLCREFCPYGRFQTTLVDTGTLVLRFHPEEAERCIRCGACVRSCPMDIDIRRGFQIECINCGRCLDACREVMGRRGQPGIIRYTFGLGNLGPRALLTPRLFLVGAAFLLVAGGFLAAVAQRPGASLKLARAGSAPIRMLDDGRQAIFFTAVVANREQAPATFDLAARLAGGGALELRGPVRGVEVAGQKRRRIDFALVVPPARNRQTAEIVLYDRQGEIRALGEIFISPRTGTAP